MGFEVPEAPEPRKGRRFGPASRPVDPAIEHWGPAMARANPWYGYKRIAAAA